MDHLNELNPAQREAVLHKDGPLLIVAGAGAGKTKTIVHRIVNLINEGVRPENILAITFTNKAASEMRERARSQLSIVNRQSFPFVSTFHSLGVNILRENAPLSGLSKNFKIMDDGDSKSLVREAIKGAGYDPKQYDPGLFQNIISKQKGEGVTFEEYAEGASDFFSNLVAKIWEKYEELLKREKGLDFDDLLLKTVMLLKENEAVRKSYQERFKYIHVDEYQDTNEIQYRLTKLLAENHKNICVIGDSDQNVYGWRGAKIENILNFEKDYPEAKTVLLEENYRSTQNILSAANEIIKKNEVRVEKNLYTKNKEGEKIGFYEAADEADEAEYVATKILELVDAPADSSFAGSLSPRARGALPLAPSRCETPRKEESAGAFSDIAILYRANFQSRILEEAMLQYNIPYQVVGTKFFERKEVKDILSYLRSAIDRESPSDIKRIINFPARGIGKVTLLKLFAGRREELPAKMQLQIINFYNLLEKIAGFLEQNNLSETIKFILRESRIEKILKDGGDDDLERLENIKELVTLSKKFDHLAGEEAVIKISEEAALMSDQDEIKEKENVVRLMTVHAAKGLEFEKVFITGLEQGLFPHDRLGEKREDQEEERRLFYVALTRAEEKLYLSYAASRTIFGKRQYNVPSEFITDIPEDLIEKEGGNILKTIYV